MEAERLLTCIREDGVPHAILIAGADGSGRTALARRAAAVYCLGADAPERLLNSPHYAELHGETVGVEDVRALMAATAMQGFNGQKRAFVLTNVHRLSPVCQNALLKTLEEPPKDTLLLLAGGEEGLLPTVRSRCMIVRLGARPAGEVRDMLLAEGVPESRAELAASLADGVPGKAQAFSDEAYLAFRQTAIGLFERSLFADTPFAQTQELVSSSTAESAPADDGEEKRKRSKKADTSLSQMLFEIWESLARDALMTSLHTGERRNYDASALTERIAARFTTGQIQSIIELLRTAQERLFFRAAPRAVIDAALAGLYEKEIASQ